MIIDLEDSVAPDNKARARESALAFLKEASADRPGPIWLCAVNSLGSGLTDADLDAIAPGRPDAIMLPKAEGGASVVHADAKLAVREAANGLPDGHIKIIPIATETAASLFVAGTYAGSSARLSALTWGAEDLSAELGAETNRDADGRYLDPYRLARTLCIAGAASARVPAIDTVYIDFRDDAGFRRDCEAARRDGFSARMAIHPAQIPIINEVFTPSARGDRASQNHRRRLRRQSGSRHAGDRGRHGRPAALASGQKSAGTRSRRRRAQSGRASSAGQYNFHNADAPRPRDCGGQRHGTLQSEIIWLPHCLPTFCPRSASGIPRIAIKHLHLS